MALSNYIENRRKNATLKKLIKKKDIKGLVEFITENIDNEEINFEILEDTFGIDENDFIKLFDEEGNIALKNIPNKGGIIFNTKLKKALVAIYRDWEQLFTPLEVQYIKYSLEHSEFDETLMFIGAKDINALLEQYFDGEKMKEEIYDYVITKMPSQGNAILKNPKNRKYFSDVEIQFLMDLDRLDIESNYIVSYFFGNKNLKRQDIPLYYDGKRLLPKYYQEIMFDNCINGEIDSNMIKYSKYYTELQKEFIKAFHDNKAVTDICTSYGITSENLQDYFQLRNSKITLTEEKARLFFDNGDLSILDAVYKEDYSDCVLSTNEIKLLTLYSKFRSRRSREAFTEIIKAKRDILLTSDKNVEDFINLIFPLLNTLETSNSPELEKFKGDIIVQLLENDNPQKALELINDVYTRNNLPQIAKTYLVFKILHGDYSHFKLDENSKVSPVLKNCKNDEERDVVIFSDLLKISLGSNNRSIRDYLTNIKDGNDLFFKVETLGFNALSKEEKKILEVFVNHLKALYNNTQTGKQSPIVLTGDLIKDINDLKNVFSVNERYNLPDRIVRMYGFFAGFKSFNDVWEYFCAKSEIADKRNRLHAEQLAVQDFKLQKGDFIKGIGDVQFLPEILQNGSVAKEYLGVGATSDMTPLDTDLSRITREARTIEQTLETTYANAYGPIWFVLKNNDGISVTRDEIGQLHHYDSSNLEAFAINNRGHYGIRTGFATSEIDYIILDNDKLNEMFPEIKHLLVINGFYIPIVDKKEGKLLFTPKEFDKMQNKMSGLKYYDAGNFQFSDNLVVDNEISDIVSNIDDYLDDAEIKKAKINEAIAVALKELNLDFKDCFDYDVSLGNSQLIDTGSTGRGTSTGKSTDFDFIMRIDSNIDEKKLKSAIMKALNVDPKEDTMKNLRLKNVVIEGLSNPVDIDISFVKKSKTNFYSTDTALTDRLNQIKKQDEKKYKEVLANIILAKKVLKEARAYKPSHSRDANEGGLGGVGVENWILQHGGSFYDAALSFVTASHGKSFEEFKKEYVIWDYGLNYYTGKFDEFVSQNMTEAGYKKMKKALEEYLKTVKVAEKDNSQTYDILLNNVDSFVPDEGSLKR